CFTLVVCADRRHRQRPVAPHYAGSMTPLADGNSRDLGRSETAIRHRPLSLSARITGAPRIRRPQTSAHSKRADACDSCVAGSVILRSRINPSERKTPGKSAKILPAVLAKIVDWRAFPGDDRTDC